MHSSFSYFYLVFRGLNNCVYKRSCCAQLARKDLICAYISTPALKFFSKPQTIKRHLLKQRDTKLAKTMTTEKFSSVLGLNPVYKANCSTKNKLRPHQQSYLLWEQKIAGSNPATLNCAGRMALFVGFLCGKYLFKPL